MQHCRLGTCLLHADKKGHQARWQGLFGYSKIRIRVFRYSEIWIRILPARIILLECNGMDIQKLARAQRSHACHTKIFSASDLVGGWRAAACCKVLADAQQKRRSIIAGAPRQRTKCLGDIVHCGCHIPKHESTCHAHSLQSGKARNNMATYFEEPHRSACHAPTPARSFVQVLDIPSVGICGLIN